MSQDVKDTPKQLNLKDTILAKMQQNKNDRAKHQEQIEGLDRGLIYLQGQLDLVEQMGKIVEKQQAEAKAAADALAEAKATKPTEPEVVTQVELSPLSETENEDHSE
jgi:hypothetical protein